MTGPATLRFTPMSEADLDWVSAVECELHSFPWSRTNFSDSFSAGYSCWVASADAQACAQQAQKVGYGIMLLVLDEAHLLNISIAREAQRKGYGVALLSHLREQARQCGARQFFLEVRASNESALALYRKTGFEVIGRRKAYYPASQGREDAIVMKVMLQ